MIDLKAATAKIPPAGALIFGADSQSAADPSVYLLSGVMPAISLKSFGAVGDGVTDDTAAVQAAFDAAYTLSLPLIGVPGRYRATAPLTFKSGLVYYGNGATLVKDFESVGYSDALLATFGTFGINKVINCILNDLWLAEAPGIINGSLLTCGFLGNSRINGLVARKTSGSWCFVLSGEDVFIHQANIDVTTALAYGDGLHITQGKNIVVSDSIIRSNSDDALAIHPHQFDWGVNGMYTGIDNISVLNCTLSSPTNAAKVGAEAYALGAGGVPWAIENVSFTRCRLIGGAMLRDSRDNTHPINGKVLFDRCVLTDDLTVASVNSGGSPRWTELELHKCFLSDVSPTSQSLAMTASEKSVQKLILSDCESDRHVVACASQEIRAPGLRVASNTTGNSVNFDAPVIIAPGVVVNGVGTEFRGITGQNAGGNIAELDLRNARVNNVQRGISFPTGTVDYADVRGGYFTNCSVSEIGFTTVTLARAEFTASATYDPPSLADGAGVTTTVTCTGAALGDIAIASFSLSLTGITVTAYVSSTNTVSVRFQNESGGTLDLASGTLRVRVIRG